MPKVQGNVKHLRGFKNYAPDAESKQKILKIVDLYESRKIPKFEQANTVIRALTDKRLVASGKANKAYAELVAKYDNATPLTGRLEREFAARKAKREATEETAYDITIMLFKKSENSTKNNEEVGDVDVHVPSATIEQKQEIKKAVKKRMYKGHDQWWYGVLDINLTKTEYEWLLFKQHRLIEDAKQKQLAKEFLEVRDFMIKTNSIFADLMDGAGKAYLTAIYLMRLTDVGSSVSVPFIPKKAKNKDTSKVAAYYKYSTTPMDLSKDTFEEAIKNHKYVRHECFINSLYDFYHDSLLSADKKRYRITREKIFDIIRKTEENEKDGISIADIKRFLIKKGKAQGV